MKLAPEQIFSVAIQAGFPADTATKMVAIALKESGGDTMAHNTAPPDDSYGLWQINMYGGLAAQRMLAWSLTDPSQLFDPLTNAIAAKSLWAGDDANLARNWYIDRGVDAQRYQAFLPLAQAAAGNVLASGGVSGGGGSTSTGVDFSKGAPAPAPAPPLSLPASALPPFPAGGLGSQSPPSGSSGSQVDSSSGISLSDRWVLNVIHWGGAALWAYLVHRWPAIAVPAIGGAALVHGYLPSPAKKQ